MAKSKRKPPKKPKEGRPSLYSPEEHPKTARKVMGEGKTLGELSEVLGINRSTLDDWRKNHVEFSVMIEMGKNDATDRVERALYERATGYTYPSEKIVVVSGGQGMGSSVERVPIKEHCPPDPGAAIHWLKNRRPTEWKDKQEVEHSGKVSLEQILAQASNPSQDHA
jgi:transposase-like protein